MTKRYVIATIAVYVLWAVLDFIIHGNILSPTYEATAELWRPMEEMKMPLMQLVTLVGAACFVLIFGMTGNRSVGSGIKYGALYGIAAGFAMGFGSYSYMPLPYSLAWSWFIGMTVEAVAAGAVVGKILASDGSTA